MRVSLVFTLVSLTSPATAFVQHQSVVQPLTSFSSTNHHVKSPLTPYINNNNVVKFSSTARKDSKVPGLIMDGSRYCCVVVISRCSDYKFCNAHTYVLINAHIICTYQCLFYKGCDPFDPWVILCHIMYSLSLLLQLPYKYKLSGEEVANISFYLAILYNTESRVNFAQSNQKRLMEVWNVRYV